MPYFLTKIQERKLLLLFMTTNDNGVDITFSRQGLTEGEPSKRVRPRAKTGKEVAKKIAKESKGG